MPSLHARSAFRARRALIAALLLAPMLMLFAVRAGAQQPPDDGPVEAREDAPVGVTTLADLGFGNVRTTGVRAIEDFFFPGPGDFELGDGSLLVVEISHSNLLIPGSSTVNVVLNDRPLRVIPLDGANIDGSITVIEVPRDVIAKDFNRLSLEYAMTLGLECEAPGHPALFATVFPTTRLVLNFASDPPVPVLDAPNLADYPYPFFRGGYPVVAPVTIVVPDDPSSAELTAAYRLAADIAARVFFDLGLIDVRATGSLTPAERAEQQLIVLGTPQRQPLLRRFRRATAR